MGPDIVDVSVCDMRRGGTPYVSLFNFWKTLFSFWFYSTVVIIIIVIVFLSNTPSVNKSQMTIVKIICDKLKIEAAVYKL